MTRHWGAAVLKNHDKDPFLAFALEILAKYWSLTDNQEYDILCHNQLSDRFTEARISRFSQNGNMWNEKMLLLICFPISIFTRLFISDPDLMKTVLVIWFESIANFILEYQRTYDRNESANFKSISSWRYLLWMVLAKCGITILGVRIHVYRLTPMSQIAMNMKKLNHEWPSNLKTAWNHS
jgi:hypothetical protein